MSDSAADRFPSDVLLDGLAVTAVRVDANLIVCEIIGMPVPFEAGSDVRDGIPALVGLEDELAAPSPDMSLPFITFDEDASQAYALKVYRDAGSGSLWILLRDAAEEAEMQQKLVQQHNSLALAQTELVSARDAAQEADQAKARFLGNVSHELRTPLHVVIGNASILMKPRERPLDPEEVAGFAADIRESGELLLQLVEDLIDISRSETGSLTLYEEWFDLPELVQKIVQIGSDLPGQEGVEINCSFPDVLPAFFADSRRIKQILINLVSNAVKAVAPEGKVEVSVQLTDRGGARLIVSDDGPGMSAEALKIARQPFGQPNPRVRSRGSGLGLAIVESLVALHNATFEIETAPGAGLRASVEFGPSRFAARSSPKQASFRP